MKWIKQKYGETLRVIRLGQKGYLDTIERAIIKGETVLLENIDETVDPVLDPLLGRNLIKKGRYVNLEMLSKVPSRYIVIITYMYTYIIVFALSKCISEQSR